MPQILVRNLDPQVVEKLKKRARNNRRSLQAEAKDILSREADAPIVNRKEAIRKIRELSGRFEGRGFPDSVELIREDRDK